MNRLETYIYRHLHRVRRGVQWGTLLFLAAVPLFNRWGFHEISGTLYSLNLGALNIVDPALVLQTILLSRELLFSLLLGAALPLILSLLLGKVFCSWVCPYNLLAELGAGLRARFRPGDIRQRHINPKPQHYWLPFALILLVLAVLGLPLISLISLPGLLSAQLSDFIRWGVVGAEIGLVLLILAAETLSNRRFWCKYLCPVGATLGLFRRRETLRIAYRRGQCSCGNGRLPCNRACPLRLDPRRPDIYPYCFNCGECVDVCRREGQALNFALQADRGKAIQPMDMLD